MWRFAVYGLILVLGGCSGSQDHQDWTDAMPESESTDVYPATEQGTEDPGVDATSASQDRKILYTANVTIVVEDFSEMERAVPELARQYGGYLGNVEINRTYGQDLSGHWVVRVPIDQHEAFLDDLSRLGVSENFSQTTQDVTEEFVDLEARIANKERLEERILQLIENSEGDIKDVIEVEHELARVRSETEQMEGRLRYLQNCAALTTVIIRAIQRLDDTPPQAPLFLDRIALAWKTSLGMLRRCSANLAVCIVFLFPWLVLLAIVAVPAAWYVYRRGKRRPS